MSNESLTLSMALSHTPSDVRNWQTEPLSWSLLQEIGPHDQPKAFITILRDS